MADEEDKAPFKTIPPPDRDEPRPPQYRWWQRFCVGALVGAAVGCLSRPAVVAAFLQGPRDEVGVVVFASCVIGALIGAFAGGVGGLIPMPMLGGALGAVLGGSFAGSCALLTFFPVGIALFLAEGGSGRHGDGASFEGDPKLYFTLMAITGVVSGALGGLAGGLLRRKRVLAAMGQANREKQEKAP